MVKSESNCLSIDLIPRAASIPTVSTVPEEAQLKKVMKKLESDSDMNEESEDEEEDLQEKYQEELGPIQHLYAGYANGSIKRWDVYQGNCTLHIEK